jgi:hypothetical protein
MFILIRFPAWASGIDVNMSQKGGYQSECAIAKNPSNKLQLFAACNNLAGPGLFAARSSDGGVTWVYPDPSKTIANGVNPALGPAACCDPSLAWDTFGNLFITYIDSGLVNIVTLLSTDGGQTFTNLPSFGPASVDQPTVTADSDEVWIIWNQSGQMVARGAAVTGLGSAKIGGFGTLQTIPGTANCSFGDITIAPSGAVVQVCESPVGGSGPASLLVNIKPDGLGPNPFGPAITATATNVGGFKPIPPQASRTIDAEANFAFDRNPTSPHFGRLYLAYTDESVLGNNQTNIKVRFSNDNGATWSNPPIQANDNSAFPIRSTFLPAIATDRFSGNIAVCWHDCRNSPSNTAMQEFCTIAMPAGPSPVFMANAQVSGSSTSSANPNQFGDYSGLAYSAGVLHPAWGDTSNTTGNNPDGNSEFDAYTDSVPATTAFLTVKKILAPASDVGRFDILVDGAVLLPSAGNGDKTGAIPLPAGTHYVDEFGDSNTDDCLYMTSFQGACAPVGTITLVPSDNKTCTIMNRRRRPPTCRPGFHWCGCDEGCQRLCF